MANPMSVFDYIQSARRAHKPLLSILLDPEKMSAYERLFPTIRQTDMVFVGGSTGQVNEATIARIQSDTQRPVVLFPGNITQVTPNADALLFLTVLTARTADVLIEPHICCAMAVRQSGVETIPMGYILIDGGRTCSAAIAAHCKPLPQSDIAAIVRTAVAGELMGKRLLYLEAGSGANTPVAAEIIQAVRAEVSVPLIVGGGIRTPEQMTAAFAAGADTVVIGNHFEHHPEQLSLFVDTHNAYADNRAR